MLPVAGRELCVSVGGSVGVKYSHIEVDSLESATPDTIRRDVKACAVLRVGSGTRQNFIGHRL